MGTNVIFSNGTPKMPESQQLFFGLQLVSRIFEEYQHPAIQTKIVQSFSEFFQQIKVRQPIGRKDSLQTVIRTSRRFDSFLYEAAQNFEVSYSYQIFKTKIKKSKNLQRLMSFSRPIQWHHSHADPIWPDGTFKTAL